jgi:hypothetical protein
MLGEERLHLIDGIGSRLRITRVVAPRPDAALMLRRLGAKRLTYICQGIISSGMNERTTVRLPAELLKRAKRKAVAEGRTLTALIEEGLRQVVDEKSTAAKGKRKLPRISKATGGLQPGVDLTQMWKIYEMEDLEYVERMKHFK